MKQTKDQKITLVKELTDALKSSASAVFVGFKTMNVHDETVMRRALRTDKVKYTVMKKTLMRRALDNLGLTSADADMPGEVECATHQRLLHNGVFHLVSAKCAAHHRLVVDVHGFETNEHRRGR
jgi:ribosomal protein L10